MDQGLDILYMDVGHINVTLASLFIQDAKIRSSLGKKINKQIKPVEFRN